jgi:hypothetical protein
VRTVASAEHGAHRSTDKRSWRSTDTRSMSSLQLYNTRTRAPGVRSPDPSGRVGLFVCRPTVTTSRTSATPTPTPSWTSSPACRGPAASPSRTCRTSPTWTTRSSAGRATRPSSRACTSARSGRHACAAQRLRGRVRARQRHIDHVISQIGRRQQAGAMPSGRAARRATGRDHSSNGRFDEDQLAAASSASASTRSRHSGRSRPGRMCT